ncbi:ribokinase [Allofustis seminis]|uniref:ribokinase n=1 Tax=Allofustis seminis TaxID=166939 RepID=UPI00036F571C|nr:ribokinase [Allofustis seminis]
MSKIVVVGSLNMDTVVYAESLPQVGETIIGTDVQHIPGGKGANQAYAVGKLGGSVAMIGAIGADDHGRALKKNLESVGVNTEGIIEKCDVPTGNAFIEVNQQGENHIIVIPGANYCLTKEDIDQHLALIKNCEVVMMQLEIPLDVVHYVKEVAKSFGKKVIIDPAPAQSGLDLEFFSDVDVMKPNETELATLTGTSDPVICDGPLAKCQQLLEAAQQIIQKGVKQLLVTVGPRGGLLIAKDAVMSFAGVSVDSVDTTAAGDSFLAAYVVALTEGKEETEALEFARFASALVVTKAGAQSSIPTAEEVLKFKEEWVKKTDEKKNNH